VARIISGKKFNLYHLTSKSKCSSRNFIEY
jgi:hypothetical protein